MGLCDTCIHIGLCKYRSFFFDQYLEYTAKINSKYSSFICVKDEMPSVLSCEFYKAEETKDEDIV